MAAITVQAEGQGQRFRLFLVAALAVAMLVLLSALDLSARSTSTVVQPVPWKLVRTSDISDQGVLIHQRIASAVAKLQPKTNPTPVCLPCIQRMVQQKYS